MTWDAHIVEREGKGDASDADVDRLSHPFMRN
jgi:hypothetical protein